MLQSRYRLRFAAGALPLEATSETGEAPDEGAVRIIGVRPEDLLATTEATAGTAPVRVDSIVFHGRTLRLHAELGQQGTPVVIDAPRQAEGFQFSVGDVAHISLRRGANCPMLPS